jgi:hypothetical protein
MDGTVLPHALRHRLIPDDLGFPQNGYSLLQTATQVPFCALVVPGVMVTRYIGPRWSLPGMMLAWGTLATCSAAVTNYAETMAVRVCE